MNLSDIRNLNRDDLLEFLGFEKRRKALEWMGPLTGVLATGIILGVGIGLLLAPKPGAELRAGLAERIRAMHEKRSERMEEASPI